MSFTVRFDPKAEVEYFEAWDWYDEQSIGLGNRFGNAVLLLIKSISNNPLAYPNKKFDCRECKVEDFPYLVIYKVFPAKNIIYITSIFHTSRSPRKKHRR
jgi:hypothetical protein